MWRTSDGRLNTTWLSAEESERLRGIKRGLAALTESTRDDIDCVLEDLAGDLFDRIEAQDDLDLQGESAYAGVAIPEELLPDIPTESVNLEQVVRAIQSTPPRWQLDVIANIQQILSEIQDSD